MRKVSALIALLLVCGLNAAISPALAEPIRAGLVHAEPEDENEHEDREETDRMHRELDERFEDVSRVIIPPRGLIPAEGEDPNIMILPEESVVMLSELPTIKVDGQAGAVNTAEQSPVYLVLRPGQQAPATISENSNKYAPIQIKDLVPTGDGPASDFMRSALTLLAFLAVIAAVLLGIASKSALRLRKKPRAL